MRLVCEASKLRKPIAIVGAGATCLEVLALLKEEIHLVSLIVDSDFKNKHIDQLSIEIQPIEQLKLFDGEILIACAGNESLRATLSDLGLNEVNYYYNYLANQNIQKDWISANPHIFQLSALFEDKKSLKSFNSILNSALTGEFNFPFHCVEPKPFFGADEFPIKFGDRLLDLGTHRGRHLQILTESDIRLLDSIICIEPDVSNNSHILNLFSYDSIKHDAWNSKLTIINKAIKSSHGIATGNGKGISNSISSIGSIDVNNQGDFKVETITLNDFIDYKPTLITADIEGDELELLSGGKELLVECRPRVAISTYHKPEHLIQITEFFESLPIEKSYKFRLHDFGYMDQVLYVQFL